MRNSSRTSSAWGLWQGGQEWTVRPIATSYEQMILLTIAILGVFLLKASGDPAQHRGLIAFAGWMSLLHGALMFVQAIRDPVERANLAGDVPALLLVPAVVRVR